MTLRMFMAVLLDESLRSALSGEIERLRHVAKEVVWVAPENLHLTLKFLGQVPEGMVERITLAVAAVSTGPAFDLAIRGLGAFPTLERPRVIWAGADEGAVALGRIAQQIDEALHPVGFPREGRPFSVHVTLGRVRAPRRNPALAEALQGGVSRAFGTQRVSRISLMRSELSPRGSRYSELAGWVLPAPAS